MCWFYSDIMLTWNFYYLEQWNPSRDSPTIHSLAWSRHADSFGTPCVLSLCFKGSGKQSSKQTSCALQVYNKHNKFVFFQIFFQLYLNIRRYRTLSFFFRKLLFLFHFLICTQSCEDITVVKAKNTSDIGYRIE